MPEVWSFLETEDGGLHDTARKMATEALRTANVFHADGCGLIYGSCSPEILAELKWYGLKKFYLFQDDSLYSPEGIAHSLHSAAVTFSPQFILFADNPTGAEIASRLAASLQKGLIPNCIDFESEKGKPIARKVVYNGRAHALFTWVALPPYLATIDLSALEDVRGERETEPEIIYTEVKAPASLTRLLKKWEVGLDELDTKI